MEKSFNVQSKELGLNEVGNSSIKIKEYLQGKFIKILKVTGSHNYGPVGEVVEVTGDRMIIGGGSGNNYTQISGLVTGGNTIPFTAFTVMDYTGKELLELKLANLESEKESLQKTISNIEDNISIIKEKIIYMQDNNIEDFDEEEFKSYKALTLLEDPNLSQREKAKILASIIRS